MTVSRRLWLSDNSRSAPANLDGSSENLPVTFHRGVSIRKIGVLIPRAPVEFWFSGLRQLGGVREQGMIISSDLNVRISGLNAALNSRSRKNGRLAHDS
jgi:hypothetical protein